jgi:hypothetical protein
VGASPINANKKYWLATLLLVVAGSGYAADSEWPYYGGTHWNERHATLTEIETAGLIRMRIGCSGSGLYNKFVG